jgi:hypothetical protein
MNPRRHRDLVRLEGCHVGLSLTDGSRIDDCQLVFAGDDKLWVFENGRDTFVPVPRVSDVWETA